MLPLYIPRPLLFGLDDAAIILITAAATIGYNAYNNYRNRKKMADSEKESLDYQNDINQQNADIAYNRQQEFQEKYLTPSAQIQSLAEGYEAVGLNKMGLAGTSPGASASTSPQAASPSASPVEGGAMDFASLASQILGYKHEKQQMDIEGRYWKEKIDEQRLINEQKTIENTWLDRFKEREFEKLGADTDAVRANLRYLTSQANVSEIFAQYAPNIYALQGTEAEARISELNSRVQLNEAQVKELNERVKKYPKERELLDAKINEVYEHCYLMASETSLNAQKEEESRARIEKLNKEVEQIGKQMNLTDKELEYYIWNHPRVQSAPFGIRVNYSSNNGRTAASYGSNEDFDFMARQAGYIKRGEE